MIKDNPVKPEAPVRFKDTGFLETDESPQARMADALDHICEVVGALTCPYYADSGDRKCTSGCWQEPRCMDAGDPKGVVRDIADLVIALEEVAPGTTQAVTDVLGAALREDKKIAGEPGWALPAEPGPEVTHVRDRTRRVWRRTGLGPNWQSIDGHIGCPWPEIINGYGPLTDVSAEYAQ